MNSASQSLVTFLLADPHPAVPLGTLTSTPASTPDPSWHTIMVTHGGALLPAAADAPLLAVFPTADSAVAAALTLQRSWLAPADRPPLRIALHTGPTAVVGNWYFGTTRSRTTTILAACAPGHIVLSQACHAQLADGLPPEVTLLPHEPIRLSDLLAPEPFFLLSAPDLPSSSHTIRAIDGYHTNLPVQPTPFLGRSDELATLVQHIRNDRQRLITLIAPSGHGKTRFSLAAATHLLDEFPDGVFFISLAPISDAALVIPTVAQTLGLKEQSNTSALEQLQTYLRHRWVLLLLDNFEQVIAAAPEIQALLLGTEHLTIIVSSHIPLQLSQEQIVVVPPLAIPNLHALPPVEQLVQMASIALFLERLQAIKPDIIIDAEQGGTIARLCALLGGVPLAIELVAAFGDIFTLEELVAQLQNDHPSGCVSVLQVLDWSYKQLSPSTQTLFARLGIFLEGCTIDGAEAVCQDDDRPLDVLDEVGILLRRNLLLEEQLAGGELRYIMLDCVHDQAYRHLVDRDEEVVLRQRHSAYYVSLATTLEQALNGPDQIVWTHRVQSELNNFRAALHWAITRSDGTAAGILCGGLWPFWLMRGMWREGLRWCEATLALDKQTAAPARGKASNGAGIFAGLLGQAEQAREHLLQALAIYRELNDQHEIASVLCHLGVTVKNAGDNAQAKAYYRASIDAQQGLTPTPLMAAITRQNLGVILLEEHDIEGAERSFRAALPIARELNAQRVLVFVLWNLGRLLKQKADIHTATPLFHEAIEICRALGRHEAQNWLLISAGAVALARARPLQAARLLGASEAHQPEGRPPIEVVASEYAAVREQLLGQCDSSVLDDAWTSGRAMTLEQALALASQETVNTPTR